ncbi:MAG TPA: TerB family tellurite resistance protein [Dongiaceae bacterium]|nr:TerB family tellurite resistance protein [Dongiaceae bacterium]
MIERVLDFLTGRTTPDPAARADELELAVAALLIEAARMDDTFGTAERAMIERLLAEKFDLPPNAVGALVDAAESAVAQSTQFFPFTQQIVKHIDPEDRVQIVEMMWEVAYADGVLDPQEDALLRRIAGLIHVPDQERGLARQRALERLKAKRPWGE